MQTPHQAGRVAACIRTGRAFWGAGRLALAAFLVGVAGCEGPTPGPRNVQPGVTGTHEVLRGTIGAEASLRGVEPVLVSGFGVVVGLNGTGGKPLPDRIAATMEREVGLRGIGRANDAPGTAVANVSPREFLRDPNVAVVLVQAAIPPAAPQGAEFDVYVEAINASSLEGGLLWTSDLRLGEVSVFGARQGRVVAQACGPVFLNPFASNDSGEAGGLTQTRGRILGGGKVTNPNKIEVVLNNASHARAASLVSAVNSRLPMGSGDAGPTAMGRATSSPTAGPSVTLRVPLRYRQSSGEFLSLVRHLYIDDMEVEPRARRLCEALKAEPAMAESIAWCLEALGERCLPVVRELYEHAEPAPRMAALRAGARLGDARAAAHLKQIARDASGTVRLEAIGLLSKVDGGPTVDLVLRELLAERELLVRVAAYEALARRAERARLAGLDSYRQSHPDSQLAGVSPAYLEEIAKGWLPRGSMQGVERTLVSGKFFLDTAPVGDPLIYITQQGRPRIVIFGEAAGVSRPAIVSAWDSRFLLKADEGQGGVQVMYKPLRGGRAATYQAGESLRELVEFCAQRPTPEDPRPGLDMSYTEVVGALFALREAGATGAGFATERDRLKGLILEAQHTNATRDRPETPTDEDDVLVLHESAAAPAREPGKGPTIVPIPPKPKR